MMKTGIILMTELMAAGSDVDKGVHAEMMACRRSGRHESFRADREASANKPSIASDDRS